MQSITGIFRKLSTPVQTKTEDKPQTAGQCEEKRLMTEEAKTTKENVMTEDMQIFKETVYGIMFLYSIL